MLRFIYLPLLTISYTINAKFNNHLTNHFISQKVLNNNSNQKSLKL